MNKRNGLSKLIAPIYGTLVLMIFWEILHLISKNHFIPSPYETIRNSIVLLASPEIYFHFLWSLGRLTLSILISLILGTALGISMGLNDELDRLFAPIIYILYPIPKVALLPILFLFFGLGELTKVLLIIFVVIFQISLMVRDAIKAIPEDIFLSAKALGLKQFRLFQHIVFPCATKAILSSSRISVGTGIAILFFVETYATNRGLGFFIMNSWSLINYLDMFSGILFLSLLGVMFFSLLDYIEKKFCRWSF